MTDQQHIDALSEPVKDALRRLQEDCRYSSCGTAFDIALIPKPSPKRDPVEELADGMWQATGIGPGLSQQAIRYLMERGILSVESVK